MKELTEQLLATDIIGLCMIKPRTIEEMTNKIYKMIRYQLQLFDMSNDMNKKIKKLIE